MHMGAKEYLSLHFSVVFLFEGVKFQDNFCKWSFLQIFFGFVHYKKLTVYMINIFIGNN